MEFRLGVIPIHFTKKGEEIISKLKDEGHKFLTFGKSSDVFIEQEYSNSYFCRVLGIYYVCNTRTLRDGLDQLQEESSELIQAASKLKRSLGITKSPTPISEVQAYRNFDEEIKDVYLNIDLVNYIRGNIKSITEMMSFNDEKWIRAYMRMTNQSKSDHYIRFPLWVVGMAENELSMEGKNELWNI